MWGVDPVGSWQGAKAKGKASTNVQKRHAQQQLFLVVAPRPRSLAKENCTHQHHARKKRNRSRDEGNDKFSLGETDAGIAGVQIAHWLGSYRSHVCVIRHGVEMQLYCSSDMLCSCMGCLSLWVVPIIITMNDGRRC